MDEIVHLKQRLESLESLQLENEAVNDGLILEITYLKEKLQTIKKDLDLSKSEFTNVLEKNLSLENK